MRVVIRLDGRESEGGAALVCHNERLQDPLDAFQQAVAEIASKRSKALADHLELGRREFFGGLYTNPVIVNLDDVNGQTPVIPSMNLLRCIQGGAKHHKLGRHVLRGMFPLVENADVLYEGPNNPADLWNQAETFSLRKGVVVSGRRVTRTRPIFRDWALEIPFEVDANVLDFHEVQTIVTTAGIMEGLGEMRPIYGRFNGTVLSDDEWLKQKDGDVASLWAANRSSIERVLAADDKRRNANGAKTKKG